MKHQKGIENFDVHYLVDGGFVRSLAKCITVINVRNLFQHFPNLLRKLQISGCEPNGNLCLEKSTIKLYSPSQVTINHMKRAHRCHTSDHPKNSCRRWIQTGQGRRQV